MFIHVWIVTLFNFNSENFLCFVSIKDNGNVHIKHCAGMLLKIYLNNKRASAKQVDRNKIHK